MDTRFDRLTNQTKGFKIKFTERKSLSNSEGEEGEFRVNKAKGISNLYIKINKKWVPLTHGLGEKRNSLGTVTPNYDSGWVAVANNNNYDFNHNLNSKILSLNIYLKDSSGNILLLGSDSYQYLGGDYESGISVYMETDNKVNIGTGNDAIYVHDNTALGGSVTSNKITSGHIRILAWKIEGL
mgnify:CR=1 FL=1|tara:strand:- start:145 stop:693 length:549 start_codon:yes stop_codon:yes gene_type:complete